jgi:hypothetical protein
LGGRVDGNGHGAAGVEAAELLFQPGPAVGRLLTAGVEVRGGVLVGGGGPQDGLGDLEQGVRDRDDGLLLRGRVHLPAYAADQAVVAGLEPPGVLTAAQAAWTSAGLM